MSAKLKAPRINGEHLAAPGFGVALQQIDINRQFLDRDWIFIRNTSLIDLRHQARAELLAELGVDPLHAGPVILTGHQPELSHPGVWVKNFAASGLARRAGGIAVNLIVDNDTVKSTAIKLPTWSGNDQSTAKLTSLPYDDHAGEMPFEIRRISNAECFASFGSRLADATRRWPYMPCGVQHWATPRPDATLAQSITHLRQDREREWGCEIFDLPVSRLAKFQSFQSFIQLLFAKHNDELEFRNCYNTALAEYRKLYRVRSRSHPAPDLQADELPLWQMTETGREPAYDLIQKLSLRPRALSLTLFARLILGDYFIHGLGGGLYDRVTDAIIRGFFGIEPPAYQILTATLHLPLPRVPFEPHDLAQQHRKERDLNWNTYKFLDRAEHAEHQRIIDLPQTTRQQRRARYRAFRELNAKLQPQVKHLREGSDDRRHRLERLQAANSVLTRRDYAWVLYPESVLRPFLQRFLDP